MNPKFGKEEAGRQGNGKEEARCRGGQGCRRWNPRASPSLCSATGNKHTNTSRFMATCPTSLKSIILYIMPAEARALGILLAGEGLEHREADRQEAEGGELLKLTKVRELKTTSAGNRFTKNRHCSASMRARMRATSSPVRKHGPEDAPLKSGEQVAADHIIALNIADVSLLRDRAALIVLDRASRVGGHFPDDIKKWF